MSENKEVQNKNGQMEWKSLGDKTKKSRIKMDKENVKRFGEKINRRKKMEKREERRGNKGKQNKN